MRLEIEQREREGVTILDLNGRIVAGEESAEFREKMRALTASGASRVVLNLKEVDYVDSTGLGTLVTCFSTMRRSGGVAKLLSPNRRNIELLVMTKLDTVFEVFDDEQEAVNSFFPDRKIKRFDILSFVQQLGSKA